MAETDLFTRLADRARGIGAITPRVPALFEREAAESDLLETVVSDHGQADVPDPVTAVIDAPRPQAALPQPLVTRPIAPGTPPTEPAEGAARLERAENAARLDRAARQLAVTVRHADGGESPRLRPREDPVAPQAPIVENPAARRSSGSVAARRSSTSEVVKAAQPPDVNISIGRIEVRAMPTPQPPVAAVPDRAPEPRGLTLAQYLRGDNGRP